MKTVPETGFRWLTGFHRQRQCRWWFTGAGGGSRGFSFPSPCWRDSSFPFPLAAVPLSLSFSLFSFPFSLVFLSFLFFLFFSFLFLSEAIS